MKKITYFLLILFLIPIHSVYADETIKIEDVFYQNIMFYTLSNPNPLDFPNEITLITENGQKIQESVTWDTSSLDLNTLGVYSIPGTIDHFERYENIPDIKIIVKVKQYHLFLNPETITSDSVTFSYQDATQAQNLHLDTSKINIWASETAQFFDNNTWYNVTNHSSIDITGDRLTISHLDSLLDTDQIYRIQLSYDHPAYELYSEISTIFDSNGQLRVRLQVSGDRNGGKRENYVEVTIPNKEPEENIENPSPEEDTTSLPIIKNTKPTLPPKIPENTNNVSQNTPDHLELEPPQDKVVVQQPPITQPKVSISIKPNIQKSKSSQNKTHSVESNVQPTHPQYQVPTQTISSGKDVVIQSKNNTPLYVFSFLGVVLGFWTIKRKKTYEKK